MTSFQHEHVARKPGLCTWSYDLGRRIGISGHVRGRAFLAQALCGLERPRLTRLVPAAQRGLGKLIPKVVPKGGDRKSKLQAATLKLDDLGIERTQSHRCQLLASLDDGEVEEYKAEAERALGELIPRVCPKGGDRRSNRHDNGLKLRDLGVEENQSRRCQLLAALPAAGAP